mmetsp:Transcript_4605/g.11594  ORF Transcript_4605/g.11594 Transcript_4605/m.11594 type:complete len:195 (-) Transcript_4605:520-1104(-)
MYSEDDMESEIEAAESSSNIDILLKILSECESNHRQGKEGDWDVPTEACLDAFYRILKKGGKSDDKTEQLPASTRVTLFRSLKEWIDEEAIVEVCLGCMGAVGSKREDGFEETTHAEIDANLIVEVMQQYSNESTIQEQACLAIKALVEIDVMKKKLLAVGEIEEELKAVEGRITNERNKKYAVQALEALQRAA